MAKRKKLPEWITKEDFYKMLESAKAERDKHWKPRSKRYTARGERINQYITAMILGFGAGLRISEIVGLEKTQDYVYKRKDGTTERKKIVTSIPPLTYDKIQDRFIKIYGKGQKERTTVLPTKIFLKAGIRRIDLKKMLPLTIGYRALEKYVKKLGREVLNRNFHFHMFRHSFASILAGSGKPLHEIQALTGHSRLDTLGIYLHANPEQTIKDVEGMF